MEIKSQYCFYYPFIEKNITLTGNIIFQISNVLRLRENNEIILMNGRGQKGVYRIIKFRKNEIALMQISEEKKEEPGQLILIQAILKKNNTEWTIQKAVELGATKIWIFQAENSVVKIKNKDNKFKRWGKIIVEAFEQSRRYYLPEIQFFQSIMDIKKSYISKEIMLFTADMMSEQTLMHYQFDGAAVVIGPEGGLSNRELDHLDGLGAKKIILSDTLLRAETAAVSALSQIKMLFMKTKRLRIKING